MTIIFFPEMFKCDLDSRYATKELERVFFLKIIAFVSATSNSQHLDHDTCHWQSMCYETLLRFNTSLREKFSKSGSLRVMRKYYEIALIQILYKFGTL